MVVSKIILMGVTMVTSQNCILQTNNYQRIICNVRYMFRYIYIFLVCQIYICCIERFLLSCVDLSKWKEVWIRGMIYFCNSEVICFGIKNIFKEKSLGHICWIIGELFVVICLFFINAYHCLYQE